MIDFVVGDDSNSSASSVIGWMKEFCPYWLRYCSLYGFSSSLSAKAMVSEAVPNSSFTRVLDDGEDVRFNAESLGKLEDDELCEVGRAAVFMLRNKGALGVTIGTLG